MRYKKIIAGFLCVVILFSTCTFASAEESPADSAASFWDYFFTFWSPAYAGIRALVKNYLAEGIEEDDATSEEWGAAYDAYVTDVQTTLGTTQVGSGGYYVWFTSYNVELFTYGGAIYSYSVGTTTHVSFNSAHTYNARTFSVYFDAYPCTVDGYYSLVYIENCSNSVELLGGFSGRTNITYDISGRTSKVVGSYICTAGRYVYGIFMPYSRDGTYSLRVGAYVEPFTYAINDYTASVGGGAGRLGNVPITFATMDENETLTPVENTYIVNEGDNEYYDIVNNVTYDMSSYSYDYSTRSYEVTYVDNDSVTQTTNVTYGDEYITVVQGGNTYNYYYIVTDTGGGEEEDPTEVIGWLEKIHNVLAGIFYAITGIDVIGTISDEPTFWDNLTAGVGSALGKIADGIGSAVKAIIEALGSLISEFIARIVNFVLDFLDKIFDFITDDVLSAAGGLWDVFSNPEGPLGFYAYDELMSPSPSPTVTP